MGWQCCCCHPRCIYHHRCPPALLPPCLQVWTRRHSDWHEDICFLPLCDLPRLRSLKMEVLPYRKCLVVRDNMASKQPQLKLRLIANEVGLM